MIVGVIILVGRLVFSITVGPALGTGVDIATGVSVGDLRGVLVTTGKLVVTCAVAVNGGTEVSIATITGRGESPDTCLQADKANKTKAINIVIASSFFAIG